MKARVLTAVALMPIVLGALFCANPWPLTILAVIVAYIGGREVSGLLGQDSSAAGTAAAFIVLLFTWRVDPSFIPISAGMFLFGLLGAWVGAKQKESKMMSLALFWVAAPLIALVQLRNAGTLHSTEFFVWKVPALLAIVPLWGGDTAAIFAGKAFGKHLLAPSISPKKTWEGAIANLLACVLVAWGLGALIDVATVPSLLCGIAAGTFGQAGDLFESYVKRRAGLKDSGTLLPGHGGLMDRIDSILFTAPVVALVLWRAM